MISDESYKLYSYIIRAGCWLKALPYEWVHVAGSGDSRHGGFIQIAPRFKCWRLYAVGSLVAQWTLLGSMSTNLVTGRLTASETLYILFTIVAYSFILAIEAHNILGAHAMANFLSLMFRFTQKLSMRYKMRPDSKDGLELFMKLLIGASGSLSCCSLVGATVFFMKNHRMLGPIGTSSSVLYNLIAGLVTGYHAVVCYVNFVWFLYSALLFVNSTTKFLRLLQYNPARIRRNHRTYRTHQIIHSFAIQLAYILITYAVISSCGVQITLFYSMTKFYKGQPGFVALITVLCPLVMFFSTELCMRVAAAYTQASTVFPTSFYNLGAFHGRVGVRGWKQRALLVRQKRSYRPLYIPIGEFGSISRLTFVLVTEFVVQNVMTLLLTFKD